MPKLAIRKLEEVPAPARGTKAVRELQALYEGFIRDINSDVGELELSPDEQVRSVKVRLRRAGTRLGKDLEISDVGQKVYFKAATKRGRPKKAS